MAAVVSGALDIALDLFSLGVTAFGGFVTGGASLAVTGPAAVKRALAIPAKIARLFTGLQVAEEESAEDLAAREAMTAAAFSPRAAMEAAEEAADEAAAQAATEAAFSPRAAMEAAEEAADEAAAQAATEAAFSPRGAMEAAEAAAAQDSDRTPSFDPTSGLDPAGFDGGGGGTGGDTGPSGPSNGGPGSGNGAY